MGEVGAFLKIERVGVPYRDPKERVGDYEEFAIRRPDPELAAQGARCMECGVPTTSTASPSNSSTRGGPPFVAREPLEDAASSAASSASTRL